MRTWLLAGALGGLLSLPGDLRGADPVAEEPPVLEEPAPAPVCWHGLGALAALEGRDGLHAVRGALPGAIAAGDDALLTFLRERVAELVGGDDDLALEVVGFADAADGPELLFWLEALEETAAVRAPAVVDRLVAMGEGHESALHRAAALNTLEVERRLDDATLGRLSAIAANDEAGVALQAVKAMGAPIEHDPARADVYMQRLLDVVAASGADESRRLLALELGTYGDPIFDDTTLAGLAGHLDDPAASVRETAALVMSTARDTDAVLERFREAFYRETSLCVRWALFRFSVRAAGARALPLLAELAAVEPRLYDDYLDFKSLYAAGVVDFERIWLAKPQRHECSIDENEGPHPL